MDEQIIRFLNDQTCATLCCTDDEGNPYCFNCFYAFDLQLGLLYFKSSADTHHARLLKNNPVIAGTILPDTLNKERTRGLQLRGEVLRPSILAAGHASACYHKKYPLASSINGQMFAVRLVIIKMKKNFPGAGKNIIAKLNECS